LNRKNVNMLSGPLFPSIIAYTIPIILTGILQLLFNAADLVVVGRYCGSLSVGAVGATSAITNLLVNFFMGLSNGVGVGVAHGLGSGDEEEVSDTVHTALPVAIISGALLTVLGVSQAERLLGMMETPTSVLPLSAVYMRIYFAGITFTIIYNYCAAILRAAGDTKGPLLFLSIAGVINVCLNVIFVTVIEMNVAGVALATVVSQGIAAGLVVRSLILRQDACHLDLRRINIRKRPLEKILRIGVPAGLQGSLFSISNVVIQSSINSFGDIFVSGNAASVNIEGFVFAAMVAFQQTAVNFIGQNTGAKQYRRTMRVLWVCIGCVVVTGLVCAGLVYLFAPTLLSIYITDSQLAISYGVTRLAWVCLPYFLCGAMDVCTGALRGLGSSFVPMVMAVMGVCGIRILWVATVFQLPGHHTPEWLYLAYPISWGVTFVFQLAAFLIVFRRKQRREEILV